MTFENWHNEQGRAGISVVIATMNRSEVLLDTLRDLKSQEFQDFEVIVVDQSDVENPSAKKLLESFPVPTEYNFVTDFRGLPQARNYGWRRSHNEIIVFIDDDIRCAPVFLEEHFKAHKEVGSEIVAGGISEANGETLHSGRTGGFNWWTATPIANYHLNEPGWCVSGRGANFSVRRSVLSELGGFDENLAVGAALYEETEFGLRAGAAGYRCWFAPKAHLKHLAAPMGGCRVGPDVSRYIYGMAHNRGILIFRHLKAWHRPTAILRMALYALSYSINSRSLLPIGAAIRGLVDGKKAAESENFGI
jgi:GT2 family glycosyltransferase